MQKLSAPYQYFAISREYKLIITVIFNFKLANPVDHI
jgi:hypothetical protein